MKLIKKLILSTLSLVFVGVTLVGTTFAWFKINSRAEISNFNFTATGGLGFMISHDGVHFQNDVTTDQMMSAIILGYDGGYRYGYDEDGDLIYKSSNAKLTPTEKSAILDDNILLMPVTSQYGYSFQDQSNANIVSGAQSGKFIEFDLYFKATSDLEKDKIAYDISLFTAKEAKQNEQKKVINPTRITSDTDNVTLRAGMQYMTLATDVDGNESWDEHSAIRDETITVASMNALRFSTEVVQYKMLDKVDDNGNKVYLLEDGITELHADDEGKYIVEGVEKDVSGLTVATEYGQDKASATRVANSHIYEFYDERDHGSYAVKDAPRGSMYNPEFNAMLTYYNAQKATDIYPIEETVLPSTTRYRVGTDAVMPTITTVKSGSETIRVTFRFWLEGWDADCFDGLAKSINVNLTFSSKKRAYES
jgi:hypothetical protein